MWKIRIDSQDRWEAKSVSYARWFTVFNENYNENNTDCDPLHVTYSSSSNVLDQFRFDPQFDACHWQSFFSWEVYWYTDSAIHCTNPDQSEPPNELNPPDFPSSPVVAP